MATIVAVRSGNWSDTSHVTGPWPGETTPTTKPGVGDTVQTGDYIVEIDEDVTVGILKRTGSGQFTVTAIAGGGTRMINASVVNDYMYDAALMILNATGTVMMTGSVTAGGDEMEISPGIVNYGRMGNVIGNITGGTGYQCPGLVNHATMGNVIGNITGGSNSECSGLVNNATMGNVIGNITGGSHGECSGLVNNATMGNVIGNITGGSNSKCFGLVNNGTIGNIDGHIICNVSRQFPISGSFKLVANPANAITVISSLNAPLTLSNDYPAEADVKSGVDYNRGTMTGELAAGGSIGPVSIVIGGGGIRIS